MRVVRFLVGYYSAPVLPIIELIFFFFFLKERYSCHRRKSDAPQHLGTWESPCRQKRMVPMRTVLPCTKICAWKVTNSPQQAKSEYQRTVSSHPPQPAHQPANSSMETGRLQSPLPPNSPAHRANRIEAKICLQTGGETLSVTQVSVPPNG